MEQEGKGKKGGIAKPIIIGLVVLVGGFFGYQQINFSLTHETTDNAQVETQITPVLPRVSGYVKSITVRDFDSVKAGQLVAELDDAELQVQLAEMEADYSQAKEDIVNAKASLENALVGLKVNKGNISLNDLRKQKATDDYFRDKNLFTAEAITRKQLDDSKYTLETANKVLENSKIDLLNAESRIGSWNPP